MMAKEIYKLMIDREVKKGQLADSCGWATNNLYNKLKRDNLTEADLKKIAEALGCELKIEFIPIQSKEE